MELSKEQQVQQLQQEYTRRIQEIQQEDSSAAPEVQEHKAVSKVTEGMIQEQIPDFQASTHEPVSVNPEISPQAEELVTSSLLNGPYESVQKLQQLNDNALTDEYHRAMTSKENWHTMVKEGKIPEVQ